LTLPAPCRVTPPAEEVIHRLTDAGGAVLPVVDKMVADGDCSVANRDILGDLWQPTDSPHAGRAVTLSS
jgi:hypothetical protein